MVNTQKGNSQLPIVENTGFSETFRRARARTPYANHGSGSLVLLAKPLTHGAPLEDSL
jgi:hypothetical protein